MYPVERAQLCAPESGFLYRMPLLVTNDCSAGTTPVVGKARARAMRWRWPPESLMP